MAAQSLPHVERTFSRDSIPHTRLQWSPTGRLGKLRHQLAVYAREKKRPRLRDRDRLFWIALKKLWKDWRSALEFVQPETVIAWQRKRLKRYWGRLPQPRGSGRPRVYSEIRRLVRTMAAANPIWGAP